MALFNREKKIKLDQGRAEHMLQNVLDVCGAESNSVPLKDLESYSNYRQDRFRLRKLALIIIMLLFLAIPLLFIGPAVNNVTLTDSGSASVYRLSVDSLLPVTSVKASIDGENVPVYETSPGVYSIEPADNGKMLITATCLNHQYTTVEVSIDKVDSKAPVCVSSQAENGKLTIELSDDSGIDFENIYAMDTEGNKYAAAEYDRASNTVTFEYPPNSLNIFIPDTCGNTLQLAMSVL